MATITGLTAARMIAIEEASVIDGEVVGDDLILTRQSGSQINAGSVRGPQGIQGPAGSDLTVVTAKDILDIGMADQIRAGRQLSATDFTNLGLLAPVGLWNLSNTNDSSGNGRNLTNKGSVAFTYGINGLASTAAQFDANVTTKAFYISDTGVNDPFRIKTMTLGCWFRTAKRDTAYQTLISKIASVDGNASYSFRINATNRLEAVISLTGLASGNIAIDGNADVCDGFWHFGVMVSDWNLLRIYLDGNLEIAVSGGYIFKGPAPLNIGAQSAYASQAPMNPFGGQIDEAFITSEILSEDQIRNLYCAKIPHTLGSVPKRINLGVTRKKKGAAFVTDDFPTQPLRLYNFSAGALTDQGSNNVTLTNSGGANNIPGVDGSLNNAFKFVSGNGQKLISSDTGLPSGTGPRSYGLWFNTLGNSGQDLVLMSWGLNATWANVEVLYVDDTTSSGALKSRAFISNDLMGGFVADGQWHFAVVVEDGSAADGQKRKLYVDGALAASDVQTLGSIVLGGANYFRIGQWSDGAGGGAPTFDGQIDSVFVCGYALSPIDIAKLYAKGAQALGISPKNAGDHVEAMTSTDLLCAFDTLPTQHQIDMVVA